MHFSFYSDDISSPLNFMKQYAISPRIMRWTKHVARI